MYSVNILPQLLLLLLIIFLSGRARDSGRGRVGGRSVVQEVKAKEWSEASWVNTRLGGLPKAEARRSEFMGSQGRQGGSWLVRHETAGSFACVMTKNNLTEYGSEVNA